MNRIFLLFIIVLAYAPSCLGQYSDLVHLWPQARLQLSQEVTVGDLFASGLRAYRRPYAEDRYLYAKHANVTIVDRNGVAFPNLPIDIMRVKVQKPWLILTMELWSPPLTIKEARVEMLKWLPMTSKTEKELDEFLDAVEADWLHYDVVNGSTDIVRFVDGWRDADGMKKTLILKKSWQWQTPLILSFELETSSMPSRSNWEYYEGPIPPPPGFEGADMKAPKDWEADNPFTPLTTEPRPAQGALPPKYQAMNDKAKADEAVLKSSPTVQLPAIKKANESNIVTTSEEPASTPWHLWPALIAAATGLLWLLVKNRK